jgi:hypothetical protein
MNWVDYFGVISTQFQDDFVSTFLIPRSLPSHPTHLAMIQLLETVVTHLARGIK